MTPLNRSASTRRGRIVRRFGIVLALALVVGCDRAEDPGDPVAAARQMLAEGRANEAAELLSEVVRLDPDETEASFLYGRALTMRGDPQLAEWAFRRAMRDPERRREVGLLLARNQIRGANPDEAVRILSDILEDDPDNIDLLILRASAYADTRVMLDEALADVARVRELDPGNLESFRPEILAFLSAVDTERADEALAELGRRLDEDDENGSLSAWYCTTMALFAMEGLETELARERFVTCVDEHPDDVAAATAAADFLREEGDLDKALEIVERTHGLISESEKPFELSSKLAELHLYARDYDEAERILTEASNAENIRTGLLYKTQLKDFYESLGRLEDAARTYDAAIVLMEELGAPIDTALFERADLAIRIGELDDASDLARRVAHEPYRLVVDARVAQERGEFRRALELYDEAGRVWPDNEHVRYHAARAAEQLGDFDVAIEHYRHATRISADTTNAMTRIAILYDEQGNPGAAMQILVTQMRRAPLDELGELLRIELMARMDTMPQLVRYLQTMPERDPVGRTRRLARIYRGLRTRGNGQAAIELAMQTGPLVYREPSGERALQELVDATEGDEALLARLRPLVERTVSARSGQAGFLAVGTYLDEAAGASLEERKAGYDAALALDPMEPIALLGKARALVDSDPARARELGERAVEGARGELRRVAALGRALEAAGALEEAAALMRRVLIARPHDGAAADLLVRAHVRRGDLSNRAVDLAMRAARFMPSERTAIQLRDVHAERGDTERAAQLTQQLERVRAEIRAADQARDAPAGAAPAGESDSG